MAYELPTTFDSTGASALVYPRSQRVICDLLTVRGKYFICAERPPGSSPTIFKPPKLVPTWPSRCHASPQHFASEETLESEDSRGTARVGPRIRWRQRSDAGGRSQSVSSLDSTAAERLPKGGLRRHHVLARVHEPKRSLYEAINMEIRGADTDRHAERPTWCIECTHRAQHFGRDLVCAIAVRCTLHHGRSINGVPCGALDTLDQAPIEGDTTRQSPHTFTPTRRAHTCIWMDAGMLPIWQLYSRRLSGSGRHSSCFRLRMCVLWKMVCLKSKATCGTHFGSLQTCCRTGGGIQARYQNSAGIVQHTLQRTPTTPFGGLYAYAYTRIRNCIYEVYTKYIRIHVYVRIPTVCVYVQYAHTCIHAHVHG